VLPLFPRSGFDQSVTTPVLIGVLVSWFFCETYGWVFAGLVVPGYLASVFLLEPVAGAIDLFEAVLTYFAARAIGEHLPRLGVTSRIFGRERFFLVVLVSILVRLAVEGWLLPRFVPHVTWAYSVGLVVVPLTANACWKTGLWRGVIQNGVPTLLVYLALRYFLVPYTNLSLAGFELSTENLAAGFLSSPKAYILLVTGAMIAAQANLRYGWDFNGILVPALLGLAIVEPVKFAATFAETMILVFAVAILIRITPLKRANIEGPRRTVLFFCVDYALRFGWAASMGRRLPGGDIVAFMGFGYLLPTLLAVKISQKSSAPLVLLPTLKISILGFVVGSLIGFAGHLLDRNAEAAPAVGAQARVMPKPPDSAAGAALWVSQLAVEGLPEPDSNVTGDLAKVPAVLDAVAHGKPTELEAGPIQEQVFLAREKFDTLITRHGTPSYLFRAPIPAEPIVALVPAPLACPTCAALAGQLLNTKDIDAIVVAGIEEAPPTWVDVETTAHAAARAIAGRKGSLLVLRDKSTKETKAVGPTSPRISSALRHFSGTALVSFRGDTVMTVDPLVIANALAPTRPTVTFESATEIAAALDPIRAATHPGELEHLIALRRLVLDPMLSPDALPAARALAPFAASSLGYQLTAPSKWADGGDGIALLPAQRGLPIAVFARTNGIRESIVEAPTGSHDGVRDLAIRLALAINADGLVIGEVFDGAMRAGAVRAAHGAAVNGRAPMVFLVREDKTSNDATIATWMDDGKAGALGHLALEKLGVPALDAPPDLATRDLATRTLLKPTAIVAITAGGKRLESASLDATRRAHEFLPGLPVRDGTVSDIARLLIRSIESGRGPAAMNFDEIVRRAAADRSVTAGRALADQMTKSAAAAIARTKEGSFIIAVARTDRAQLVVAAPLDASDVKSERRASLEACVTNPIVPGICEAPK
jgi:hypothetical protein